MEGERRADLLYLLDTNIPLNLHSDDRHVTDQLYGGDREMRIRQEIVLGIGGYRALQALGLHPTVYHMNEGHSAFLSLEHVARLMHEYELSFAEARELASASLVFTLHTPVDAGHDYFSTELIDRYFAETARRLGLSLSEFRDLGRLGGGRGILHDGSGSATGIALQRRQQAAWRSQPEDVAVPKARRYVPLSERVSRLLQARQKATANGWVFPSPRKKGSPISYYLVAKGMKVVKRKTVVA